MEIFIYHDNKKLGPLGTNQVNQMLENGDILLSDMAWYERLSNWLPLSEIPPFSRPMNINDEGNKLSKSASKKYKLSVDSADVKNTEPIWITLLFAILPIFMLFLDVILHVLFQSLEFNEVILIVYIIFGLSVYLFYKVGKKFSTNNRAPSLRTWVAMLLVPFIFIPKFIYKHHNTKEKRYKTVFIVSILSSVIFCWVLFSASFTFSHEKTEVHRAVLQRLKAPSTAKFVSIKNYGDRKFFAVVDAQNGFGAFIRTGYCVVLSGGDPNYPDLDQVFECTESQAEMFLENY